MQSLPSELYNVDSVVELEQVAIKQFGVPAYELMKRAGQGVFNLLLQRYSASNNISTRKVLVLCGAGNNAGDGYVVATLAKQAGLHVKVISLIDPESLKNEAMRAYQAWTEICDEDESTFTDDIVSIESLIDDAEVIIDALLGTGLQRSVSSHWSACIDQVNKAGKPVISVDIPSGLYADSGAIAGNVIDADITVCFIGLKPGMFTAEGIDACGDIVLDDLGLPAEVYENVTCDAQLIESINYELLPERKASSHKGRFGHVLIAGGNIGMPGAVILAARAALRSGAGLVTIITAAENLQAISSAVPEAMVKTYSPGQEEDVFNESLTGSLTHVAVGMGLGQDDWALALLKRCISLKLPLLIDADGLNLLAESLHQQNDMAIDSPLVITPHPGEAARLLSISDNVVTTVDIQGDRFNQIRKLRALFADTAICTIVLKGAGSLIYDGQKMRVCHRGNAAMAAPGMGDVLSGICIGLMAQGLTIQNQATRDQINQGQTNQGQTNQDSKTSGENSTTTSTLSEIVSLAVCLHAAAADVFAKGKTRGLLASDVIDTLPELLQ